MQVKYEVVGMPDNYTTREEAEERANELGGEGSHSHSVEGQTYYMPFNTHEEYMNAVKRWHDDEEEKQVSARVEKALKKKVADHNASVSVASKKTSLGTLKKVFKRGVGAYNTNPQSVRPNVSSPGPMGNG